MSHYTARLPGSAEGFSPPEHCVSTWYLPRASDFRSVRAVAAERMYGPGSSDHFATVSHSLRDEIFVAGFQRNAPPIDCQRVASLNYDHVLVVLMHMRSGRRCLTTRPECHLATVSSVKDISLYSGRRLVCCGDPVCGMLHELREITHEGLLSHSAATGVGAGTTERRYSAGGRQGHPELTGDRSADRLGRGIAADIRSYRSIFGSALTTTL